MLRAASKTPSVMTDIPLILRMRPIWTNSRWSRRKLPRVIPRGHGDRLRVSEVRRRSSPPNSKGNCRIHSTGDYSISDLVEGVAGLASNGI
jgi:hypothetical protein